MDERDSTAWIGMVPEAEWSGELGGLLAEAADPETGRVDHILGVHSLHPKGLAAHLAVYRAAMAGTPGLRKLEREMVALVVSQANGCHY